jgi:hypothetical protein
MPSTTSKSGGAKDHRAEVRIPTREELANVVQRQQEQIQALLDELHAKAEREEQEELSPDAKDFQPLSLKQGTYYVASDTPIYAPQFIGSGIQAFIAAHPGFHYTNTGFYTPEASGYDVGVRGIGSNGDTEAQNAATVGVLGMSLLDHYPADGTGVKGISGNGAGVEGHSFNMGVSGTGASIGVLGAASDMYSRTPTNGPGVVGQSGGSIGVKGQSARVGVQGQSGYIGVLGGPDLPSGLPEESVNAGVVGIGPTALGGYTFSYGGWFGLGPSSDQPGQSLYTSNQGISITQIPPTPRREMISSWIARASYGSAQTRVMALPQPRRPYGNRSN